MYLLLSLSNTLNCVPACFTTSPVTLSFLTIFSLASNSASTTSTFTYLPLSSATLVSASTFVSLDGFSTPVESSALPILGSISITWLSAFNIFFGVCISTRIYFPNGSAFVVALPFSSVVTLSTASYFV